MLGSQRRVDPGEKHDRQRQQPGLAAARPAQPAHRRSFSDSDEALHAELGVLPQGPVWPHRPARSWIRRSGVNDTEPRVVQLVRDDRQLGEVGEVGTEGVQGPVGSIGRRGGDTEPAEGNREPSHPDVG